MKKITTLIFTVVLMFALGSTTAQAATDPLQSEINQILSEFPTGVQTGPGEISWNDGEVILNLEREALSTASLVGEGFLATVGSCASGYFCAYTSTGLTGSKISFSSCTGTNSVSPLGSPVRSVANARGSGMVYAYNGISSVLSVSANSWSNTSAAITRLGC